MKIKSLIFRKKDFWYLQCIQATIIARCRERESVIVMFVQDYFLKKWGSGSTGYGGGGGDYFTAIMKIYHDIVEAHYMNFGGFHFWNFRIL